MSSSRAIITPHDSLTELDAYEIAPTRAGRKGLFLYNGTDQSQYIAFGDDSVSPSVYTFILLPGETYEMLDESPYTGPIYGASFADTAGGVLTATELLD